MSSDCIWFVDSVRTAVSIVDCAIGDCVFAGTGLLYQCGNETMALVNQGLLLLEPVSSCGIGSGPNIY